MLLSYLLMISLACQCAQLWVKTRETLGHPLGICSEVNHVDHPKTIKEQVEKVGVNPREFVLGIGTEEMPPGDVIDASEQILDPILPGQEFPLPLHLAEAGRIRWRTAGTCYVWSETHSLSNILAQGNKPGFPKSFVCYHSNPNSDPFWCCMSVHSISLCPAYGGKDSHLNRSNGGSAVEAGSHRIQNPDLRKMRFIRQVRLASPFLVKNYLPLGLSLKVDCGGVAHPVSVSKEDTASLFYVDSTHDLGITFNMQGFGPTVSKFPRPESFIAISKSNGSKFISSEILTFNSDTSDGSVCVNVEKAMDPLSGAREICLSVPYLLYNCTGVPLTIIDNNHEKKGCPQVIPSSYYLSGHEQLLARRPGLACLYSEIHSHSLPPEHKNFVYPFLTNRSLSTIKTANLYSHKDLRLNFASPVSDWQSCDCDSNSPVVKGKSFHDSGSSGKSGSTSVSIPQPWGSGAFLVSVTSFSVATELSRRTWAVTFQPRYVICNACKEDICYKQKGTDFFYGLRSGQHSHLHWSDTTRELLVSIRFNEPGWQWSGGFLPDFLGDTQVKMLNYASGALNMVRAEVQNADLAIHDNMTRSSDGNSMTQLILLSDDETGFMPYRIDNFSKERLRIYQQRCENFKTSVNPYTSCQCAWDEPCYTHRLVVEVPGERILGTYCLDDTREYMPIFLPSTSDKPDRRFHISITAEGAIKVFSIVDLNCHVVKDVKETELFGLKEKKEVNQRRRCDDDFSEMITLHLPFVGVSLMNSSPQELVFASMKDTTILLLQSLDQQKFLFQILSLQIDNQLPDTPYPITLSFDNELRGRSSSYLKSKEHLVRVQNANISCDSALESVFHLAAARWRKADPSLISFEYVNLWLAPLCIEFDEQILSSLLEFFRTISSRLLNIIMGNIACQEFQIAPIGAPWQHIYLFARKQKKIYVEFFELAPIKLSISFSSTPWMVRNETRPETETFIHISGRGLMALIDVEDVPVHLTKLTLEHLMASKESIQEILTRHYTRQLLHEIYKEFGSAGVIGNPMGFARNVGVGIKDFLSISSKGIVQVSQGSKSLLSNIVNAISSATTQFSKAAHKGIVAFTFDEHTTNMDGQRKGLDSGNKGLVNEFLEKIILRNSLFSQLIFKGVKVHAVVLLTCKLFSFVCGGGGLTGLLQSPIKGAEKHGLPGVLSAMGKAAQSIRNRSSAHQANRFRVRLARPLSRELPLLPYSWEEAIGVSALLQADESRLKDERFIMCKEPKQEGKFIVITDRLFVVVWCAQLVGFRSPKFVGVATDPGWVIETEMNLESVVHIDREENTVNIIGSNLSSKQTKDGANKNRRWSLPPSAPLFQVSVDLPNEEEAIGVLQLLVSAIEQGRELGGSAHLREKQSKME
ncbi:Vacuolar protein sorting-associated protein 13 [Dioscorea alata]|uniref:Vacuolar protein sorting-associated protein 13 n=1 Tax=Dioscorea alata TaxID=55571 RepID=A0ACB7WKQ7_DIOAL|nr:Vacuolar protein sorting-associated protein 13 [Dioscorea alata]